MSGRPWPAKLLPEWADQLARTCTTHTFGVQRVHGDRRSVVATRTGDGTGPLVVVTDNEDEMRAALGLKPHKPPS